MHKLPSGSGRCGLHHHQPRPHARTRTGPCRTVSRQNPDRIRCRSSSEVAPVQACGQLKVYAISDLHTDYPENLQWVKSLPASKYKTSVLVLAGDVSDSPATLEETLEALASKFLHVFFVAGNHELWVKGGPDRNASASDSVAKLQVVLDICRRLGVHTSPKQLGQLWIAPVLAWHHRCFDTEPDVPGVPRASAMTVADYAACSWPAQVDSEQRPGSLSIAQWAGSLNSKQPGWSQLQQAAARPDADVITFSHFLPSQQLLPEKRFLLFPNLAKAVGSVPLLHTLLALRPQLHVFGHTHFAWDAEASGIRCIQAPLCYPNERRHRLRSIVVGSQWSEVDEDMPPCDDVAMPDWLPVLVYKADWRAELVAGGSGMGAGAGSILGMLGGETGGCIEGSTEALQLSLHGAVVGVPADDGRGQEGLLVLGQQHGEQVAAGQGDGGAAAAAAAAAHWSVTEWESRLCPELSAMWSDYYKQHSRQPDNVELAPWVAKRYKRSKAVAAAAAAAPAAASEG